MLNEISYYPLFGKPLLAWLGLVTLTSFFITAALPILTRKRIYITPISWHNHAAAIALLMGMIHGGLAILSYF